MSSTTDDNPTTPHGIPAAQRLDPTPRAARLTIADRRMLTELTDHLRVIRVWLTFFGMLATTVVLVGLIFGVLWVGDHAGWWQVALR